MCTEQRVLSLLSSKAFAQLKALYGQTTLFNVIGSERSENRHSAFLCWLLNPSSSHGLGTEPLKLFLRLVATLKWGPQTFGHVLYRKVLAGNYDLELMEPIELEKNVGSHNKDRIDIWMVACLTYEDDGQIMKRVIPIVIENKIYSSEGQGQTTRYQQAVMQYIISKKQETGMDYRSIGVLLSPDGKDPKCGQFTSMTYQQLLDYVLTPVSIMKMPNQEYSFIETYIRNLGRASSASNHDYSPLAISSQERDLLEQLYKVDSDLFDRLVMAVYGIKAEQAIGKSVIIEEAEKLLMQELWDANEEVFKAVVFHHYKDKKAVFTKLFKGNNRDNTKYRVYYGKNRTEVFPGKRLSKAMAACAVFKAYLACHPETTLEELREAFPCKDINTNYWGNYYDDLFYLVPEEVDDNGEPCLQYTAQKRKGQESLAAWDFNLSNDRILPVANGKDQVMCVKFWRKGDFDRLMAHVEKHFSDIIFVEECL